MNIKSFSSKITVLFGAISSSVAMIYTMFLFLIGTRASFIPSVFYDTDIRNLSIAFAHTISVIFAVIYFTSYYSNRYNSKLKSMSTFNIIMFLLGIVLVFHCYYTQDVEALIFIMTINGLLMSMFIYTLSVLKYDVNDPVTSKSSLLNLYLKITSMSSLFIFIFAIITYYRYTSILINNLFNITIKAPVVDAISVFLYFIGNLFLVASFVIMYFCEIRLRKILKQYKEI